MTEGEFPFRSFTMRSEGYDRNEVESHVAEMQSEIVELRRALDTATPSGSGSSDTRLHDPEGAVLRTLAIAQETADRVLHDAQVEADRRRADADEHATGVIADADERAARLLGDMEAQAAEVREQGVAAARSAIQVERDKAMAELAHVRRVRDDLRNEAVDLKAALDRYRSQAREASDTLAAASSGPLMGVDLPDFVDDDVVLAGITSAATDEPDYELEIQAEITDRTADDSAATAHLRAVDDAVEEPADMTAPSAISPDTRPDAKTELADVISIDADLGDNDDDDDDDLVDYDDDADDDVDDDADQGDDDDDGDDGFGGTFLAEVRAAAKDDDLSIPAEGDESDRFLSELRGIADDDTGDELESDAADTFFEDR